MHHFAPHKHGRRGGRIFGHGGLRLVVLHLISDKPAHGYELIKEIEDRLHGAYSPSPGVIYPTLTWLEELGYIEVADSDGGRKRYAITSNGRDYLQQNQETANMLMDRFNNGHERPPQIVRAIENFKMAVHLRLSRMPLDTEQINAFTDILDDAAKKLERL